MGTKTRGLRMARASKEDLKGLQLFKDLLDRLEEVEDHWTFNECFPKDEYPELRKSLYFHCQNDEEAVDWFNLLSIINDTFLTGWFRVVFGYEVLIDNCQNKENEDSLDFNAKIQAGFAALDLISIDDMEKPFDQEDFFKKAKEILATVPVEKKEVGDEA